MLESNLTTTQFSVKIIDTILNLANSQTVLGMIYMLKLHIAKGGNIK